jgi:hypothetical protein
LKTHKNTPRFLHPSAGILASRKWECAVLITTKKVKKVENLSRPPRRRHAAGETRLGAPDPAAFLNARGILWQSIRASGRKEKQWNLQVGPVGRGKAWDSSDAGD